MFISKNEPVKIISSGEFGYVLSVKPWKSPIEFIVKTEKYNIELKFNDLEFLNDEGVEQEITFDKELIV